MAQNVNSVIVSGHVVADAELKHLGDKGTALLEFSIGNNRGFGDYEKVNFFNVKFWGKGAEAIQQYVVKGKKVTITGEIEQERWEQDGNKRSKIVVKAREVELGASRNGESQNTAPAQDVDNDSIPF